MKPPTVVFVPGLRDHVPDHWQTLLQERVPGSVCVPRLGRDNLSLAAWVTALDQTISEVVGTVVLVAHSAGALMVAHWAPGQHWRVRGAVLATPPDLESAMPPAYPPLEAFAQNGWMPIPRQPLPFPATVVASANDPLGRVDRVEALARAWGSELVNAGEVGHLNPAAGFGPWPLADQLLAQFGVSTLAQPVAS